MDVTLVITRDIILEVVRNELYKKYNVCAKYNIR